MKQLFMNLVLYVFAWLLHKTYTYRYFHYHNRLKAKAHHPQGVSAIGIWHGNSLVGTLAHTYQPYAPLCSQSPDGRMVAFLCRRMGLNPVLGSSTRGGKSARETLEKLVDLGVGPAITVDGPKGPVHKSKNGIIELARKCDLAILPAIARAENNWVVSSWDKLKIPKPFSKVAVCYAEPILVPKDATSEEFEACRQRLDNALMALEKQALDDLKNWSTQETLSFRKIIQEHPKVFLKNYEN